MRDTGLIHYQLGVRSLDEVESRGLMGSSFEVFVGEEIYKGLHAACETTPTISYWRTRDGEEIDFIFQGDFGTVPIAVKSGLHVQSKNLATLQKFLATHNLDLGLVVTRGEELKLLSPKILQIPARLL